MRSVTRARLRKVVVLLTSRVVFTQLEVDLDVGISVKDGVRV